MKKKAKLSPVKKNRTRKDLLSHRHFRIIPWTMTVLTAFYLISLIVIIQLYPDIFSVPSSYAEDGISQSSGSINNQTTNTNQLSDTDAIKSKLKNAVLDLNEKTFSDDYSIRFSLAYDYIESIIFRFKSKSSSKVTNIEAKKNGGGKWEAKLNLDNFEEGAYVLIASVKAKFPTTGYWSFETPRAAVSVEKQSLSSSSTSASGSSSSTSGSSSEDSSTSGSDSSSGTSDSDSSNNTGNTGSSGSPETNSDTSGSGDGNVTDISPVLKFIEPTNGSTLKKTVNIIASVQYASMVDFNLVKKGSLTEQYLGKAKKTAPKRWKLEVQTKNIPNGEYKLLAKVKNQFGSYKSQGINVKIQNENDSPGSSSETEDSTASSDQSAASASQNLSEVKENIKKRNKEKTGSSQSQPENTSSGQNETVAGQLSQITDSDQDGVSNEEEKRIGTDQNSADTDKDGYLDGDEIKNGYNPLKSAKEESDKVVFESPKEKGEVKKDLVKIESVASVEKSEEESPEKDIQIAGKGLPNSFITLYIYSETPTIVTVMTDESGNWSYTMDKDIEDGQHEAYVAVTDNEGHIAAKSEPFFFVKTAQAVVQSSEGEAVKKNAAAIQSPVAASRSRQITIVGIVILISLLTAIACIGLYLVYRYHHGKENSVRKDYLASK